MHMPRMNSCTKARQRCSAPNRTMSFPWHWTLSAGFVSRLLRSSPLDLSRAFSQLSTAVNRVGFSWGREGVSLPVNKNLNFRVEVRAGTGKVSTGTANPADTGRMLKRAASRHSACCQCKSHRPFHRDRGEWLCCKRGKTTERVRTQGLPPWKGTRVKWFFIKPFLSGL